MSKNIQLNAEESKRFLELYDGAFIGQEEASAEPISKRLASAAKVFSVNSNRPNGEMIDKLLSEIKPKAWITQRKHDGNMKVHQTEPGPKLSSIYVHEPEAVYTEEQVRNLLLIALKTK